MKKITSILLIATTLSSCSIKRNISVVDRNPEYIISNENDTIKMRKRLFDFVDVGGIYNFRMIGNTCVDVSVNKKKN